MLKKRKGEIATLLTLGLVLLGGLITLGTSLFVNNQKSNFASNSRAAVCSEVYECFSINPPVCKKKNFDLSCQYTNYTDADIGKCAGLPCNRNGIGLTATPTVTPRISTPTSRPMTIPRPTIFIPTLTPVPGSLGSACGVPLVACKSGLECVNRKCVTQISSCIFNPSKTCPAGTTMVSSSGFCGCVTSQTNTIPSPTSSSQIQTTKRCVAASFLPIINHPARVEEYKNGRWQSVEECLYPKMECDSNTFSCVFSPPNPNGKDFGSDCSVGNECKSGNCASSYSDPWGETISLFGKKCVYPLSDQIKFVEKKGERDAQTANALLTVAVIGSPIVRSTYKVAITAGLPAATNYLFLQLQQPWIRNSAAAVNVAANIYSLSDCVKNGPNGEWCNMLAAIASGNPGEFGLALGNDLSTLKTSAIETFRLNKMPSIIKNSDTVDIFSLTTVGEEGATAETISVESELLTVGSQVVVNQPPAPNKIKYPSIRGGYVEIDSEIGGGGFGKVFGGTLYEPGTVPKQVVAKFPRVFDSIQLKALQQETTLLAEGQNALPSYLRGQTLAKPYGFIKVGAYEIPIYENFGQGARLSEVISRNFPNPTFISRAAYNDLLETARALDGKSIYMRDIFPTNIFVTNDGRLILYDPFYPRFNPNTGKIGTSAFHPFDLPRVNAYNLNQGLLTRDGLRFLFRVPTGNEEAIKAMLQLYNGLIIVK